MKPRTFVVVLAALLAGCKDKPADPRQQQVPEPPAAPTSVDAAVVPAGALKQLPWLMGTFRGTGADGTTQEEFFERNSLINDSTLIVESFENATLTGKIDTTRYELRHDSLTNLGAGRYIATAISADSVTFGPFSGVNNFFTWRKESDSTWIAMIFPFGNNAGLRIYKMTRLK